MDSGEADILTSVLITPSRRSALAFSDPINRVGYPAIIAKSRSEPLTDLESLRGKRVALVKDISLKRTSPKAVSTTNWLKLYLYPKHWMPSHTVWPMQH
ncbi:transporter substrate-binding domain-containing protein [Candidatus Reidiella endopervernicosa]|uniref:Transporter substrate-binding domain-containing protein n=1 Tax=Candidatus Reidiella endopervernicosa TaxID=2738883 RepID=A0A6N0HYE4_9GAMM|nr:transporter substrate-binding domain-containing protein [Candidatus Reidiella endopervernicosa]